MPSYVYGMATATAFATVNGKWTRATVFCAHCEIRSELKGWATNGQELKRKCQSDPFCVCWGLSYYLLPD